MTVTRVSACMNARGSKCDGSGIIILSHTLFLYVRWTADDDCRGDLVCFEREDGDKGSVPGCTEKDGRGSSGWDYWWVCLILIGDNVAMRMFRFRFLCWSGDRIKSL